MSDSSVKSIERVLILDDNPLVQAGMAFPIEVAARTPVRVEGPLGTLEQFLQRPNNGDAAVSDYQLSPGNYAAFDGAMLVSAWYRRRFPAVLCTAFGKSNVAQFRVLRRWIPVLLTPDELGPDSLFLGFELAQAEFEGRFQPQRRPWRALVHFVEFDESTNTANAKVPGWSEEVVALRATDLPGKLTGAVRRAFAAGEEFRCFAVSNLGSESNQDLYISDWELDGAN